MKVTIRIWSVDDVSEILRFRPKTVALKDLHLSTMRATFICSTQEAVRAVKNYNYTRRK